VYLDGGVRRGGDILVALALGARAVMIGRPAMWGLAVGGAEGVARVLDGLRTELADDAGLCGLADVTAAPRDLVADVTG
jgi:4-hydroxymandelate oxidase